MPKPAPPQFVLSYQSALQPASQVFAFDGSASITKSAMSDFPTQAVTVSFWVKSSQSGPDVEKAVLFTYDQGQTNAKRLYIKNPANLEVGFGGSSTGATRVAINDGYWHQVTVTVSPADTTHYRVQIYNDGLLAYQSLGAVSFPVGGGLETGGNLVLGQGDVTAGEKGLVGAMSEFRVWSKVSSGEQVWTLLQQRLTGSEPDLTLYWALTSASTAGVISGGQFVSSDLRFRTVQLMATVSGYQPNNSYRIQYCQLTGGRFCRTDALTAATYVIPRPNLNQTYSVQLQVTVANESSDWSASQQVVTLNLEETVLQPFQYDSTNQALTANWHAADQAQQYKVTLFQDGTQFGSPTLQVTTSYVLATQLNDSHAWNVQVNAVSGAAYGPLTSPVTISQPNLTFNYVLGDDNVGLLEASWPAIPGAGDYYLVVSKQNNNTWTQVFSQWTSSNSVVITNSQVPTQQGEKFKATVRALGPGAIGAWSVAQETTIIDIPRPTLTYAWVTNSNALAVSWNDLGTGVTYRLRIFQDTNPTPIVDQRGMTALTYDITSLLPLAHVYTIKVSGQKSGSDGPANHVVVPPAPDPTYQYNTADTKLTARWATVPNAYLKTVAQGGSTYQEFLASPANSFEVPAPGGGFQEGGQYDFQMRALAEGTLAAINNGRVFIHNLAQPVVNFVYTDNPTSLTAKWEDIRTQQQKDAGLEVIYRVQVTVGGTPQAPLQQATLTLDMTNYLPMTQTSQVTIQVTGLAGGSVGLPSQVAPPAALGLGLLYDQTHATMAASWQASSPVYLRIYKQGDEAHAVTHYALATESTYQVPAPGGGFQVNDVWICQAKSLPQGVISSIVTTQATVLSLSAPTLTFEYDASTNALAVTWPDILTAGQSGIDLVYEAALYQGNNTTPVNTAGNIPNTPAGRRYTLPDKFDVDDTFTVKVRGMSHGTSAGTLGPTNTPPTLSVPSVTTATYTASSGQVAVAWSISSGGLGYSYYIELVDTTDSSVAYKQLTSALSTAFSFGAVSGRTYRARVRALASGTLTSYSTTTQSVTIYPHMVAPTVHRPTADASASTVAASWEFDEGPYPSSSVSYLALLSGDATASQTVSSKSVTFGSIAVAAGKTYTVSVQAISGGTYGNPGANSIVVDGPPAVSNVNISTDVSSNLTVVWTGVPGGGYVYKARLRGPDNFQYDSPGTTSSTTVVMSKSNTNVVPGSSYYAEVAAVKNGITGPWSASASVQAGKVPYVPPNNQPNAPSGGDPISFASGMFSTSDLDLVFGGIFPLQFITYYSVYTPVHAEYAQYDGKPMGNRRNHTYNTRLSQDSKNKKIYLLWGSGAVDTFRIPEGITGNYPVDGIYNGTTLYLGSNLVYVVTLKDQTRYLFDQTGRLTQIASPVSNTISLSYLEQQLHKVTDDQNGHWFQFSYNGDGRINGVTDSAGRAISYTYFSNGDLKSYTDPLSGTRSYVYWDSSGLENKSLLKTTTDPTTRVSLYQEYEAFDDGGTTRYRVTFQQDANAYAADHQSTPVHYGLSISYSRIGAGDQATLIATVTDNMGNQSVYRSLAVNGNLLDAVTTLPGGNIYRRAYTYDTFNNVLTETTYEGPAGDAGTLVGNTRTFTYDGNLNLLTISYPAPIGQIAAYTYYDNNLLKTSTDYLGNTTSYLYFADNTLKQVTDPLRGTTSYTYYPGAIKGLVKTRTDELSNVFTYTYNQDDIESLSDPLGNVTRYGWNALGLNSSIEYRNALGEILQTRAFTYNNMGFQTSSTVKVPGQSDAQAYKTTLTPTVLNQTHTATDATGSVTTFTYDNNLNLETITYPQASGIQSVTTNGYDRNNNLASVRVSPTVTELYTYDPLNRRKSYTDPNTSTYTFNYAWLFQGHSTPFPYTFVTQYPLLHGDSNVYQTTHVYDVLDRPISETNRAGKVTTLAYSVRQDSITSSNQLVVTTTLPEATAGDPATQYQTVQIFDAHGRLVSLTNERGQTTTITYRVASGGANSSNVLVMTVTDPLQNQKISTFDALGKLVSVVQGKDTKTVESQYAYDVLDRLTKVINVRQLGNLETSYAYAYDGESNTIQLNVSGPGATVGPVLAFNGLGKLVRETDATVKFSTRTYHPRGFLHSYVQANGKSLTYDYDDAGRYTRLSLSDGSEITQVLDNNGNRTSTKVGSQVNVTRTFDKWNRIASYTNNHEETITYTYTPEDKLHVLGYPALPNEQPKTVTYDYDGLQRLHKVTDWSTRATTYNYYPTGLLSSASYPNQCATQFEIDSANRFTGITNNAQGRVVYSAAYTLNALGEPDTASFILPIAPQYAVQNNSYHYNAANELDVLDGAPITYDDSGNTTGLPGVSQVAYNDANLITSYGSSTYSYNVEGLRDLATVDGTTTRLVTSPNQYIAPYLEMTGGNMAPRVGTLYDSPAGSLRLSPGRADTLYPTGSLDGDLSQVLQTVDGAGALQKRYIYGVGLIGEESAAGDYRGYLFDERGSTIALADNSGSVVSRFGYDAYGSLAAHQGELSPFLYNGRDGVISDSNGLSYMRSRYFRPAQMRFLQRDFLFGDLSFPQTLNRYAYVAGDPIFMIDPLGLDGTSGWKIFGGIVGGIAGGLIIGGIVGLGVAGLAGGSGVAGGIGGAVGGGLVGGLIGGLVGGPIGGIVGGIGGAVGGGGVGVSAQTIGTRLTTWGLPRLGQFIRGLSKDYRLVNDIEMLHLA